VTPHHSEIDGKSLGATAVLLIQCFAVADWRQIQARIRKARMGPDALLKMAELYQRTHDAMVAFELARLHEKAGANDEAVTWYTTARERFRRPDWRKKAEEALGRLGAPVPATTEEGAPPAGAPPAEEPGRPTGESQLDFAHAIWAQAAPAPEETPLARGEVSTEEVAAGAPAEAKKRSRRGRRGGRGRRKHGRPSAPPPLPEVKHVPAAPAPPREEPRPAPGRRERPPERPRERAPEREVEPGPISIPAALAGRVKAGDPALASRSAHLESQLRRLLAAAPINPEEFDTAPAGPGVLLLSDSELTSHYYVEPCQTLRVALRLIVQGKAGRSQSTVRARLAEHLGINDAQAGKYLKQHCAVRWIQLDEGAAHLAHFAVALLRPALNE
jgi:hypothetical protein